MPASLQRILGTLGGQLIDVLAAPYGLGAEVDEVVIVDADDPAAAGTGALALVIGARGRAAIPALRTAAAGGAVAVAVKSGEGLTETATEAGTALLGVRPEARWERVEALVRGVVEAARAEGAADDGGPPGDLFALAQATATLAGGPVTIEDVAGRLLAYSQAGDEADELRRQSILGRRGPERYLALLRKWGVYRRLRESEGVVRVEERPELGIRRRLAAGIHAGSQALGVIWVQEGAAPLTPHAERVLLGASRTLAPQLIRLRTQPTPDQRLRDDVLAGLLDGRLDAGSLAAEIGADPTRPATVAAFAPRSGGRLERARLVEIVAVHAAAYRRGAVVSAIGDRVYALLPDLSDGPHPALPELAREITAAARRHLDLLVHAGLGDIMPRLADAPAARADADRVLDVLARADGTGDLATVADVRSQVLLAEILDVLADRPRIRDPRVAALSEHDARHGRILVPALGAYLDAHGDVRAAARRLNVHPNTVRYRIRRAQEVSGLRLDDPDTRLLVQFQLRLRRT